MTMPRSSARRFKKRGQFVGRRGGSATSNECGVGDQFEAAEPEPAMRVLSDRQMLQYAFGIVFKPHPQSEARRRSAVALIKYLLAEKKPEVLSAHYRELLSVLLWKITEAEAHKHKTRFKSQGALDCSDKAKLRHEHVFQRSRMIAALEKAAPHEVDDILNSAIGCTVTVKEHSHLSKFDKEYGWQRYRKAGIVVIDTLTGERIN